MYLKILKMERCPICSTPCKNKEEVNSHIALCVSKLLSNSVNQSMKQQLSQGQQQHQPHKCIVERLATGEGTHTDQLIFTKLVNQSIVYIKKLNLAKKRYFASILSETRAELLDLHQKQKEFDKLLGLIIELDSDDDDENSDNDDKKEQVQEPITTPTIEITTEVKKQSKQPEEKKVNINITKNNDEKTVVAEKNKGFTCTKCTKTFRYKGAFDKHFQSKTCVSPTNESESITS